jgi:hypothetical protein
MDRFVKLSELEKTYIDGIIRPGSITISANYLVTIDPVFIVRLNAVSVTGKSSPNNTIQLDQPDLLNSRIDIIYINPDGSYGKVTGIAANTQVQPSNPLGTILLASIYIYGGNLSFPQIDVQPAIAYYKNTGGDLFGDVVIKGGHDLVLQARLGSQDSGDLIFKNGNGVVLGRIWKPVGSNKFVLRFNTDSDNFYELLHTGNILPLVLDDSVLSNSKGWSSEKINLLIQQAIGSKLQPWTDTLVFTYDGVNNTQQLNFTPNSFGGLTSLNGVILDPFYDFKYSLASIVILQENLTVGIEYKLITQYFKI